MNCRDSGSQPPRATYRHRWPSMATTRGETSMALATFSRVRPGVASADRQFDLARPSVASRDTEQSLLTQRTALVAMQPAPRHRPTCALLPPAGSGLWLSGE